MAQRQDGGLGYLLTTSAHAWRASLGRRLEPLALTPSQFFVLAAVYHRHHTGRSPLRQTEIAGRTGMDVNVVSQVTRGLETRGLLARERSAADSRAHEVTLTAAGLELATVATAAARTLNDDFFADIPYDVLAPLLERLTHAI